MVLVWVECEHNEDTVLIIFQKIKIDKKKDIFKVIIKEYVKQNLNLQLLWIQVH